MAPEWQSRGVLPREDRGDWHAEARQMRLTGDFLADGVKLRFGVGTVHGDGAKSGLDDPNQLNAEPEVRFHFLCDVVLLVIWREDLDGENRRAVNDALSVFVCFSGFCRDVSNVHASNGVR